LPILRKSRGDILRVSLVFINLPSLYGMKTFFLSLVSFFFVDLTVTGLGVLSLFTDSAAFSGVRYRLTFDSSRTKLTDFTVFVYWSLMAPEISGLRFLMIGGYKFVVLY
jgi:hypothetical protein